MLKFLAQLIRSLKGEVVQEPLPPPPAAHSDVEYEHLLWALLAEVERGKSWGELRGFLIAQRWDDKRLAQWLQGYGERWLAQPEPDQELAGRLVKLGQVATGELGTVARTLGERLLVSSDGDSSSMSLPSTVESKTEEATDTEVQKLNQLLATLNTSGNNSKLDSFQPMFQLKLDDHIDWYNRGNALENLGRIKEAIASYDQALKIQPDYHIAWYNRGIVLKNLGRLEEAIASYDQALKIQPDKDEAWGNRGDALKHLGRFEEAIASYNQALKIRPDFHIAWDKRGTALADLGRIEEAIASFDQALKIQSDYYIGWNNRGYAAAKSLGYEPYCQQQFAACFRLDVSKAPQWLIPALKAINQERHLAQFQASLSTSTALLLETFAHLDAPNLIALIQQPPPPELSQFIQQSPPQKLIEWIQQPLSEAVVARLEQDSLTHPPRRNPLLNQRGYEGQLASYQAELDKAIRRDTHPEGWGVLHHRIGLAHYFRGQQDAHPSRFWRKAETSYKTALQTLKSPEFAELHLEVLQDLIRVLLDLGEKQAAQELQRQGADLLRRMLADSKRTERQKRELALKSAVFNQLSVDLTLQLGDVSGALTLAETGKNICLRWLLGTGEVPTIDDAQFQRLLTPTTAAIYWHLSPSALTTFVILSDEEEAGGWEAEGVPNVTGETPMGINPESPTTNPPLYQSGRRITHFTPPTPLNKGGARENICNDQRPVSLQQVLDWEEWLDEWNQRYQAYGSSKLKDKGDKGDKRDKEDKKHHPWRTQMEPSLERLQQILNIAGIEQHLQNHAIDTLILIPHRDLHRFPIHALFDNYTCTYLPSANVGLQQQAKPQSNALNSLLIVENPKSTPEVTGKAKTLPPLPFAEVEAALIRQRFSQITSIENPNTTHNQLLHALSTPHHVFHFTGHGAYNSTNPAQSCLFLYGTDQLTLSDIVGLDLSAYFLVCLAACETAVTGNQTITDEYVGLVSAFLKAGVTYVVSTLWTVESAVTTLFFVEFYQQLHAGQPPKAALKATQSWLKTATRDELIQWLNTIIPQLSQERSLKLLLEDLRELLDTMDDTQPPYHHPYYWAAFTISGL